MTGIKQVSAQSQHTRTKFGLGEREGNLLFAGELTVKSSVVFFFSQQFQIQLAPPPVKDSEPPSVETKVREVN